MAPPFVIPPKGAESILSANMSVSCPIFATTIASVDDEDNALGRRTGANERMGHTTPITPCSAASGKLLIKDHFDRTSNHLSVNAVSPERHSVGQRAGHSTIYDNGVPCIGTLSNSCACIVFLFLFAQEFDY